VVLLCLWDSACAGCGGELRALDSLHRRAGGNELAVLAVAQGMTAADAQAFYAVNGVTSLPVHVDRQRALTEALRRPGEEQLELPRTIVVDRTGHLRGWLDRSAAWDSAEFSELLNYFRGV
jgi:peroxiredoxin